MADQNPTVTVTSQEIRETCERIMVGLRVTKVVCTRAVKGARGDTYVGFSAQWDTVQDDGARDLCGPVDDPDGTTLSSGVSVREARLAATLLGMQADVAAHENARSGGNLSNEVATESIRLIRNNYQAQLEQQVLEQKRIKARRTGSQE